MQFNMYFPIATTLNFNYWILKSISITSVTIKSPTLHNLHIRSFDVRSYDISHFLNGFCLKTEI
jgi:hypothetical protein